MIRMVLVLLVLLMQVQAANLLVESEPPKILKVRLTAYWMGQDKWTDALKSSSGRKLVCGVSCAVDPNIIPYGSRVTIKKTGRTFIAVDTGTAVKNRKAEWWKPKKLRKPVVDLFFKSEKEARKFLARTGRYVEVEIRKKEKK